MSNSLSLSRRRFLKRSTAAFVAPFVTSGLRAASPNGKLRHASFGAGGMAWGDIASLARHNSFELVAVADVDQSKFAEVKNKFPNAKLYQDWRELMEKEGANLDSINISTPDHMHGPMALSVIAAGKHLYGQKPLTQNLKECRAVRVRAKEAGIITQMGIQVSSAFSERLAVQAMHDGAIGQIKEVHTFSSKTWGDPDPLPDRSDPIPEGLNWDHWLGVAAERNFIEGYYHPENWRRRRDFGTGTLGDMGCHIFSGWFRGLKLGAPIAVTSRGPAPNKQNWAINGIVEYLFRGTEMTAEDRVKVTWYDGSARPPQNILDLVENKAPAQGSIIIGTDGVMLAPHMSTPTFFGKENGAYRFPKLEPRDHYAEFVDCCLQGNKQPSANFDYAGPLTEAVLLGCLASIFPNEELHWDTDHAVITNHEEANREISRNYRTGWEIAGL